ncbi:bifunctional 2-polyprenyl-6-hydroxyphenol methylase/3-demethylubiquinol 3-O-methyltransferase UbiG [Bradyrhizobium sp. AUGA SZCCT0283]|uniref:class I SAM-dependent methyltransferase n=1 Tax=Bradyrhizobium sp. AUGA SZCCT0283 TaxID=2807671 RepID=UPI001BAD16EE|nr:class I SAM-dependent methyltransferase [Bradyrhizobium sp. AUGA SZCCT0283]MBR1277480.1 methyltransferase domain-containing protein [Bradyrhizobium sp. AUGA SZCCT0283]
MMERLSLADHVPYSATEAAIHIARYLLAKPHVEGKRVLDIACGEGYGSHFLKSWGAFSVCGIDVSADAISAARLRFEAPDVSFEHFDASDIQEKFPAATFDVIVSLETIEHIDDPKKFLMALKNVAKPDATFIISCPNDHWYYPDPSCGNPFHKRKYSIGEFQALTSKILGSDAQWLIGSAMLGFGAVGLPAAGYPRVGQSAMIDGAKAGDAVIVPPRDDGGFGAETCSYFIGIWGAHRLQPYSTAAFPISMTNYATMMGVDDQLASVKSELAALRADSALELAALRAESAAAIKQLRDVRQLEEQLAYVQSERDRYRIKSVALQRELEIVSERLQKGASELAALRAESASELAALRAESAAAIKQLREVRQLEEQLADVQSERDRYRIKSVALQRELEIVSERLQQGASELAGLRAESASELAALRAESAAAINELEQRLARLGLKGRARRLARSAKPIIPKAALPLLFAVAKRLKF